MTRATALVLAAVLTALTARAVSAQRYVPTSDPAHPRIKFADSLVSANDRCMVTRAPLKTKIRPMYVNGVPVGFCCVSCPGTFANHPESYLRGQHLRFGDPIAHGRPAVIDSSLRIVFGHDLFYFADAASRARFEHEPLRWCGALTDPVTQRRFRPDRKSPQLVYEGRRYVFANGSNLAAFQISPAMYARRHGM